LKITSGAIIEKKTVKKINRRAISIAAYQNAERALYFTTSLQSLWYDFLLVFYSSKSLGGKLSKSAERNPKKTRKRRKRHDEPLELLTLMSTSARVLC